MKPSIVVVGSTNTDMVIKAERLPAPGETILGGTFFMNAGGKGANQAVAAKRLGGDVTFLAKTGNDIFGRGAIQSFREEGINTDYIVTDPTEASGVALITVDKRGENCIAVAPGANGTLTSHDLLPASAVLQNASVVLLQLEIPLDTVQYVAELVSAQNRAVILNPAPACELPASLFQHLSIITPNEKEAEMITGIAINDAESAKEAASAIQQKGVETVIITLGAKGAYVSGQDVDAFISAPAVNAVDTTAAGDVFNGALAVGLAEGQSLQDAVGFACKAASISVTKLGAQASAPHRHEIVEETSVS